MGQEFIHQSNRNMSLGSESSSDDPEYFNDDSKHEATVKRHRNMLALSSNVSQEDIVEENRFQHVKSASVEVPRPKVHEVQTSTRAFHQSICTFNFVCTAHATPLACFLYSLGSVSRRCGHTRALAGS